MPVMRINREQTALLVVDMQRKLLPVIEDQDRVTEQVGKLIRGCAALDVLMAVTEQYPDGLGRTVQPIRDALPDNTPIESKLKFSACVEAVRGWLSRTGASTVLVAGIESHVCVTQTVLDLLSIGVVPVVVADAIGARRASDHEAALMRMRDAGATIGSVEMVLFEMVAEAGTERFKAILPVIK